MLMTNERRDFLLQSCARDDLARAHLWASLQRRSGNWIAEEEQI